MVAGDLSTLRFIRAQSLCHPYRRVPPLEMTVSAGSIQSFTEGQIDQNAALTAKRRPAWMECHLRLLPYSTPAPLCGPLRPGGKRVT